MFRGTKAAKRAAVFMLVSLFAIAVYSAPVAQAEPATSMPAVNASSASWFGGASNRLGTVTSGTSNGLVTAGDVNGDGASDVLAGFSGGAYVLFTPQSRRGATNVVGLQPKDGYQIRTGTTPAAIANVGDQNADGIDDAALSYFDETVFVIYGVADPTTLPQCGGPAPMRCVDASTLDPSEGYQLDSSAESFTFGASIGGVGDFNGDGEDDFVIGDPQTDNGDVYIVYGGLSPVGSPYDIDTLNSTQALHIVGSSASAQAGTTVNGLGDMNGDGLGDVFIDEASGAQPMGYVLFGTETPSSPMDLADFDTNMGYTVSPPLLTILNGSNAGDVNGDGRPDLLLGGWGPLNTNGQGAVIYSPSTPSGTPISSTAPTPQQGYTIMPGDSASAFGGSIGNAGDLNGDGIPDQMFGGNQLTISGNANAGGASIAFGQRPGPSSPFILGTDMTPERGIALTGTAANQRMGIGFTGAGDLDEDGIPDYFLSASGSAVGSTNNAGIVYLIPGSSLVPAATTGGATGVTDKSASLAGAVSGTRGEGSARFEWGTTDDYGQSTAVQVAQGTSTVASELTGLSADTTYHYRVVAENSLGVARYGEDRSFTTAKETGPTPTQCELNPAAPGCGKFCEANPKSPGCITPTAGLSELIAGSQASAVRRGGKTSITAWITSTGSKSANGVKICAKVPNRTIKLIGNGCRTVGSLAAGKTAKTTFQIKIKPQAKRKSKLKVRLVASANEGMGDRTAVVKVAVK